MLRMVLKQLEASLMEINLRFNLEFLKLRYYLQVKFIEEITEATDKVIEENKKDKEFINDCFKHDPNLLIPPDSTPPYEKRIELYDKYLKDKTFDDIDTTIIDNWLLSDVVNISLNSQVKGIINGELSKKYGGNGEEIKNYYINIIHKFPTKESVYKLLNSMRDVYILGLFN